MVSSICRVCVFELTLTYLSEKVYTSTLDFETSQDGNSVASQLGSVRIFIPECVIVHPAQILRAQVVTLVALCSLINQSSEQTGDDNGYYVLLFFAFLLFQEEKLLVLKK
jgi:hypothetical protein